MDEIAVISPGTEAAPADTTVETPETPAVETPEGETPATSGEEAPAEGADDEPLPGEPEEEPIETDGRALDEKTRKIVSELKKTNPVAAKALADEFYRRLAYAKEFPTVQDARQAKATLDSLGGEEGITEMQGEVQDYRTELKQFADGDPALIEQLYRSNPRSTGIMVEHALEEFAKNNNFEGLDKILLPPIVKRLNDVGLANHLVKAAKLIEEGKGQEAYDTLGAIGQWLSKLTTDAKQISEGKAKVDPRQQEFSKEREAFEKEKAEHADRVLSNEITRVNNDAMAKVLDPFFKEMKFGAEGKREFTQQVLSKAWALMKADTTYVRNARNIRAKQGGEAAAKFISRKFAEVLPIAFRNHKNTMYPNLAKAAASAKNGKPAPATGGKPPAKPVAAAASNGNAVQVKDAPKFEEVNWDKTNDMLWAKGFAHLKSGKYVYFH